MTSARRALALGVLMWLIPFVVAFLAFPLRASSRPLFESIMPVAVTGAAAILAVTYFRRVAEHHRREGLALGLLWLAVSVIIDAPLMLFGGPMQMSIPDYVADIGLTYLIIPTVTLGIGVALAAQRAATLGGGQPHAG